MSENSDFTKELLLRQYETLRKEIEGFIKEQSQVSTCGVVVTGLIWAWILTNADLKDLLPEHPFLKTLLFVPFLLAALFFYRIVKLEVHIHVCSDHIAKLEAAFGLVGQDWESLAWEVYWKKRRMEGGQGDIRDWHRVYWFWLCLVNLLAGAAVAWTYRLPAI
ncbi:MAG: hypothetical protein AB7I30_12425 [Isosphaeraceae bacterium]